MTVRDPQSDSCRRCWLLSIAVWGCLLFAAQSAGLAQEPAATQPQEPAAADAAAPAAEPPPQAAAPAPGTAPAAKAPSMPSLWDLTVMGGIFMAPLFLTSIVVVAFAIERHFGLRGKKILPPKLLMAIQQLNSENGIDPRQAYQVCQQHPSPLANVIRAAILKIGRPHSELEQAVQDAVGREADVMADNIRPINVCVSIAPLIGLLGTVQGMIAAFMVTSTTTATGAAKAQELAQGIYTALVTTFAGLCVAIPAVILAHWFEGRIERLLRDMEDIFLEILPQFERFEGKLRVRRSNEAGDGSVVLIRGTPAQPAAPAPAPAKAAAPAQAEPSKPVKVPASRAAVAPAEETEAPKPKSKGLWNVMGAGGKTGEGS